MEPGSIVDIDLCDGVVGHAMVVAAGVGVLPSLWWDREAGTVEPNGWWTPIHLRSGAAMDLAMPDPESAAALAAEMAPLIDWDRSWADIVTAGDNAVIADWMADVLLAGRATCLSDIGKARVITSDHARALR